MSFREIQRLKSKITELEVQLNQHHLWKNSASTASLPEHLDPLREHGGNRGSWEYVYARTGNSQQIQCYGPASSYYFMKQMNTYLKQSLASIDSDYSLESDASFMSLFRPIEQIARTPRTPATPRGRYGGSYRRTASTDHKPLSRWQEDYFLDLFWHSYHCIYPILDEADFRAHHNSLWTVPWESRKTSPLVDIVLAICMQYATALLPLDLTSTTISAEEKGKDAATAGRSYYRRCQSLLQEELEGPSIVTLQCRIFSVIYLSNAGSKNAAYAMLAMACRTGVIMGLHREPLNDLDENEKNKQRRLWWTVYILELKAVLELGRHMGINMSQVTARLPTIEPESGTVSIPGRTASSGLTSSFTTNLQWSRLILAWRSVYVTFYHKCADLLGPSHHKSLYENALALESCAEFLSTKMEYLKIWLRELPESLKAKRRAAGEPLSTDGTPLDFPPTLPFVQQRQQIFLELHYHSVAVNLLRPFICFSSPSRLNYPVTEAHAISCLEHAMMVTDIIHQALIETDLLHGWLETFHWLVNAFLSLIGYVISHPAGERTAKARISVKKALSTFDILSSSLAMASTYAKIARDLSAKADLLSDNLITESMTLDSPTININTVTGGQERDRLREFLECDSQDISTMDTFEMVGSDYVLQDMFQFDLTAAIDWIPTSGNDGPDIWTLGPEYGS
jgi:hypothetical protein